MAYITSKGCSIWGEYMSKKQIRDLKRLKAKFPYQKLTVTIPLAVSINHLYMYKRGKKFMTKKGMNYMEEVMKLTTNAVKNQNYQLEEEGVWLVCELKFYFPDLRRRDCHNQHKLIMDALEHIAFKEDRWVLVRDMYVGYDKENPRVEVTIYPL